MLRICEEGGLTRGYYAQTDEVDEGLVDDRVDVDLHSVVDDQAEVVGST